MTAAPLEARVHDLLAGREVLPAGRLNVIGLDRLRRHFGESWDKVSAKVETIAQRTIDRHLGSADVVLSCDNLVFVILFAELDRREAEVKALFVAQEIARHVLGDTAARAAEVVETCVADLDAVALSRAPDAVAAIAEATSPSQPPPGERATEWKNGRPAPLRLPDEIRLVYRPVWDVGRHVLSTYHCTAIRSRRDGNGETGSCVLLAGDRSPLIAELDQFLVDRVIRDLERLKNAGRRVLLSCRLHAPTLRDPRQWARLTGAFADLPPGLGGDLVVELAGLDQGIPIARLHETVGFLRGKCRALTARIDLSRPDLSRLSKLGIATVAFDLVCRPAQEAATFRRLNAATKEIQKAGLKTLARGLDRRSLVVAALGAGCDYVEGAAIHGPVDTPENILRYHVEDVFAAPLSGQP